MTKEAPIAKKAKKTKKLQKEEKAREVPPGCGADPVVLRPPTPLKKPAKATKAKSNKAECKKVITIPQYTGTCWFNAILMSALFSQHMRGLLLNRMEEVGNGKGGELQAVLWDILKRRYKTTYEMKDYAYMYFKLLTPEAILKKLHDYDSKRFNFNPLERSGYFNYLYYPKLLEFLGAKDILMLDNHKGTLYWSVVNGGLTLNTVRKEGDRDGEDIRYRKVVDPKKILGEAKEEYDVVLIYHFADKVKHSGRVFGRGFVPADTFEHEGRTYLLDSLLLTNFNTEMCKQGHDISGITCDGDRYMYNGWIRSTVDPAMGRTEGNARELPCELMKYDWLDETGDFCLSRKMCKLHRPRESDMKDHLCFNTHKGERVYVYVNEARCGHKRASAAPSPPGSALAKVVAEEGKRAVEKKPKKKPTK